MPRPTIEQLVAGVLDADRRSLAQAITLVESARVEDDARSQALLEALAPRASDAHRIGVSGIPGAGKSTLIEALGMHVLAAGHKVAVLAVDPTSALSGGSILGDKTRMERLSREENAFIRPTAGGGQLGGVAPRTREAMLICEAAGFDTVLVETIGIGQSEAAVRDLVDTFALLTITGAGDDLQGIKRGVLELADLIFVTKADGENEANAQAAATELRSALHILRSSHSDGSPTIVTCSAKTMAGVPEAWEALRAHRSQLVDSKRLAAQRIEQDLRWLERRVDEMLRRRFLGANAESMEAARNAVRAGELVATAANRVLNAT